MPRPKKIVDESQSANDQSENVGKRTKSFYSPDTKARVAIEAIIGELTIAEIVEKYDIKTPVQVPQWKDEALKAIYLHFSSTGRKKRKDASSSSKTLSRVDSILGQASKLWTELDNKDLSVSD